MDREPDPIAELARLIANTDPYRESKPVHNSFRQETTSERYNEPPGLAPALQLPADLNPPEQTQELNEYRDDEAYDVDHQTCVGDEEYQTEFPHPRRRTLALVMAGLALLGTAGAFVYRDIFADSVLPTPPPIITASDEPNKTAPASSEPQAKDSGNARQVGPITTGSTGKLVSREEQPTTIEPPKGAPRNPSPHVGAPAAPTAAADSQPKTNQVMPHIPAANTAGPSPNAVASQRAGQLSAADKAEANQARLAAAPIASAEANSTPAVTPPVLGSGYAVQVTSERTERGAQAAFRALQTKYPNQLSGRQPMIRRADLGAAGIYYRALVGPFASAEKAAKLCSGLKAAGGDCIIQKN